jgi:hypothetical protein
MGWRRSLGGFGRGSCNQDKEEVTVDRRRRSRVVAEQSSDSYREVAESLCQ